MRWASVFSSRRLFGPAGVELDQQLDDWGIVGAGVGSLEDDVLADGLGGSEVGVVGPALGQEHIEEVDEFVLELLLSLGVFVDVLVFWLGMRRMRRAMVAVMDFRSVGVMGSVSWWLLILVLPARVRFLRMVECLIASLATRTKGLALSTTSRLALVIGLLLAKSS